MIYQVLIVDDEEIVCRGLKEFVKWSKYGFEVADIAYSVDEALSILEKKCINVIFTDIKMPRKTGLDLLKIVSEKYGEIKSVILSGHSDFQFAKKALQYGAIDYLTKPVNLKEVEALLVKLHKEIEAETLNTAIQKKRMEGLLLSLARGYSSYEEEQYQIPDIGRWYGLSIGLQSWQQDCDSLESKILGVKNKLSSVFNNAIMLSYETSKIFIILPCENSFKIEYFVELIRPLLQDDDFWACGISNPKFGLGKIKEAFFEAGQALRYILARQRGDFLFYKNIEPLYETDIPDMAEFLEKIISMITGPETRGGVKKEISDYLFAKYQENNSLINLQISSIRGLIEIKGYLQKNQIEQDRDVLNQALANIMTCNSFKELEDLIMAYIETLISSIDQKSESQLGTGVVREIQFYIMQHYEDNISLQALAKQFYLHPNYLSRMFKEKTGENFVDYVTRIRMNKVIDLLNNTDYKIVEICEMVGYDNPRYFSKAFKQFTGKTPREYRDSKI